ncbi:MAG TPA: glycoside hydrolase family protein, partial [Phycisphaerales bacterium]
MTAPLDPIPTRYDEETLLRELHRDEGLRLKPYRCTAGKLTIGVGRNLDDVGITAEEADYLLRNDVYRAEAALDRQLPWWRNLSDVRQRVILNMAFNLGMAGLLSFKTTLGHVEAGRYLEAAQSMLASKWARQVGPRAERLA